MGMTMLTLITMIIATSTITCITTAMVPRVPTRRA